MIEPELKQLIDRLNNKKERLKILTNELLEEKATIRKAEARCAILDLDIRLLWADILKLETEIEAQENKFEKEKRNEKRK